MSGFVNVIMYFVGLAVFGFLYWLLDGIMDIMIGTGVADTTTFSCYDFLLYIWAGIVLVYLVFGGIWLVRSMERSEVALQ